MWLPLATECWIIIQRPHFASAAAGLGGRPSSPAWLQAAHTFRENNRGHNWGWGRATATPTNVNYYVSKLLRPVSLVLYPAPILQKLLLHNHVKNCAIISSSRETGAGSGTIASHSYVGHLSLALPHPLQRSKRPPTCKHLFPPCN